MNKRIDGNSLKAAEWDSENTVFVLWGHFLSFPSSHPRDHHKMLLGAGSKAVEWRTNLNIWNQVLGNPHFVNAIQANLVVLPIVGRPREGVLGDSVDSSRRKPHPRRQQLCWWQAVTVLLSASCTLNLDSLYSPCPLIVGRAISFLLFFLPKPFCLEMAYSHLSAPHSSFKPYPKFLKNFPTWHQPSLIFAPS